MTPAVSVIIPAYNAAQTLAASVASAQRQSCREIEILIVDDGSTDDTAAIAGHLAAADPRICLMRQANRGVAHARNSAIRQAAGAYVAMLDADDLWHPDKLARQLDRFATAPVGTGLVYCWFRRIDFDDRVIPGAPYPRVEGAVLHRHLEWNFISTGSTPMVPTPLAAAIGYDEGLDDEGRLGCEDYLFQLQIARMHGFACTPAFLTGYRRGGKSFSTQTEKMIHSHLRMYQKVVPSLPESPAIAEILARRRAQLLVSRTRNRLNARQPVVAARYLMQAIQACPWRVPGYLRQEFSALMGGGSRGVPVPASTRGFDDFVAEERDGPWASARDPRYLVWLAEQDGVAGDPY